MATKIIRGLWPLKILKKPVFGCFAVLLFMGTTARSAQQDDDDSRARREYLKSRYEDFFIHYHSLFNFEQNRKKGTQDLHAKSIENQSAKELARRQYLKTRKLPGPYNEMNDGTKKGETDPAKIAARKAFIEHRQELKRLEKTQPHIPDAVQTGIVDPLNQ
jgi:hypothetical protein